MMSIIAPLGSCHVIIWNCGRSEMAAADAAAAATRSSDGRFAVVITEV